MVWVSIIVALVMAVVGELLRPKPKLNNAQPSAVGDFNFPTADASRVIPVFWGTCKMQGPNVVWFGDLKIVTLTKKVKTGWFSSKKMVTGYNYYLGVQLVFAYGECDEFIQLRADDHVLTLRSAAPTFVQINESLSTFAPAGLSNRQFVGDVCSFYIDSPNILDNGDPASGVRGPCKLYKGTFTQPPNMYLGEQWDETDMSAFRPLLHLVMEQCYLGNSDTPPPISLIARRCPNQLGLTAGRHNVNGDANIACAAFEVMTDRLFGMKIPPDRIDRDSFVECGNTTAAEGLGISMLVQTAMQGRDLLAEMLRHADAVVYADPVTGLYTMKLARDDYDLDELLVIEAKHIVADSFEFSRTSWEMTKNTLIVEYTDRESFTVKPVQYQDLANIDVRGGMIDSETIAFHGYSNAGAAMNTAARACKVKSSPLVSAKFSVDRIGYQLRPGSVFILRKPDRGLANIVMRVIEIAYGTLDDPAISLTAMEDVFAVNAIAYVLPQPSEWRPVISEPVPLTRQEAFEVPYEFTGELASYLGTLASPSSSSETAYEVWNETPAIYRAEVRDFTPSGILRAEYPSSTPDRDSVGFSIDSTRLMEEVATVTEAEMMTGDSVALIISNAGREFIGFRAKVAAGSGVFEIKDIVRGIYGTTKLTHTAGARVWFVSYGFGLESEAPQTGVPKSVFMRYLPKNSRGTLPFEQASQVSVLLQFTGMKPSRVQDVRVNGQAAPNAIAGDAAVSWVYLDRITAAGRLTPPPGTTVPAGTTFNVAVYVAPLSGSPILVRNINGVTDLQTAYTVTQRKADAADKTARVFFSVVAVFGGQAAPATTSAQFYMTGAMDPLLIATLGLADAEPGSPYLQQLASTGGAGGYTYEIAAGSLPAGLELSSTGAIAGTWTGVDSGVASITFRVVDAAGQTATRPLTITLVTECQDYTRPDPEAVTTNLSAPEAVLPPTGSNVHVCEHITNPLP